MTTLSTSQPHTPADLAEGLLAAAAEKSKEPFGRLPEKSHDAALQGIGHALLAIASQLADNTAAVTDIGGAVTDVAAHLEQLAMTADDLANGAAELQVRRTRRAWRRRPAPACSGPESCQDCHASGTEAALEVYAGRAYCSNIRACLARRHGEAVLSAADVATIRQALADARRWQSMGQAPDDDHTGDAAAATRYAALRERLGEG
jgi:hypothetical protein